jgi:hypothetical protein
LLWTSILPHIPKIARYTIGARLENKFLDLVELSYAAYFTGKERKAEKISDCIAILDRIKYLIAIIWEAKHISHKQFEELAGKVDEIGRMLFGWKNKLENPEKNNISHVPSAQGG